MKVWNLKTPSPSAHTCKNAVTKKEDYPTRLTVLEPSSEPDSSCL